MMKLCSKSMLVLLLAGFSCAGQDFHKWAFEGGAGPTLPVGSTKDHLNLGWNLLLGGGYNFTPHIAGTPGISVQSDELLAGRAGESQ